MKHLVVLIVAAGSVLAYSQTAQQTLTGEIRGVVTDGTGNPISAATVYAVPQGLALDDAIPRWVKTDRNGAFDFRGGLQFETYKLYARKDADAYPDPLDSFYADPNARPPVVQLTQSHPSATVAVKLGQKAAIISGRIIDASTGAAVKAELGFEDAEGHGHSVLVDGNYRVLVPPGKEVTLMVTLLDAPPYRSQLPVAPLRLEPGQYVSMDLPVSRQ